MAGLRVDQHRIHRVGLDLPLPPVAAAPARAGLLATHREFLPGVRPHNGRDNQGGVGRRDLFQTRAAEFERTLADVNALQLQQIVSHDDHRHFAEDTGAQRLAPDTALHLGEGQRLAIFPGQHFAVHHHAVRQLCAQSLQLRKAVRHQFLAAGPHEGARVTMNQLRADAIPFPFHLPFANAAEFLDRTLQRVRQEERIRAADVRVGRGGRDQLRPECGGGLPVAHQPVRDNRGVQAADRCHRAHHQALRHTHAKLASYDLVPGEALAFVHFAPR